MVMIKLFPQNVQIMSHLFFMNILRKTKTMKSHIREKKNVLFSLFLFHLPNALSIISPSFFVLPHPTLYLCPPLFFSMFNSLKQTCRICVFFFLCFAVKQISYKFSLTIVLESFYHHPCFNFPFAACTDF